MKAPLNRALVRPSITIAFIALLLFLLHFSGRTMASEQQAEFQYYDNARNILRGLLGRSEGLFREPDRAQLQQLFAQLNTAVMLWGSTDDSAAIAQAIKNCADAVGRSARLLDQSGVVERVSMPSAAAPLEIRRQWPAGRGVLLLRISRDDLVPDVNPGFARAQSDLSTDRSKHPAVALEAGVSRTVYAPVFLDNAPSGVSAIPIRILSSGAELARVNLTVETPPMGELRVTITDQATGKPTPAVAGVYSRDEQLMVPAEALAFDEGGFYYNSGRVRPNLQAHYWPGTPDEHKIFFIGGEFSLRLPEGTYKLIAGKGMEYIPATEQVSVKAGSTVSRRIVLKRWVDMPSRGWYSGDTHVHYARGDAQANERVMQWTQAEDVHVASILRMGDARETYFEQYGFGPSGRFVSGDYALVPGQEDPRTNVIGHTLHLNLQAAFRVPEKYYLYDRVFAETHRQGGLNGYAHMYRAPSMGFFVTRDMSLNIPTRQIDFVELCEFGDINEDLYYEYLNLGFPLAVSAGSDVPWGNTIGTSRVYAYTGVRFDADAWFAALKAGHTFVTSGPMLEFTVNGQLPGSSIEAHVGDTLHIKATASGDSVLPEFLEVVEQGAVIRSAPASKRKSLSVEFDVPVRDSSWIAARCAGAHTTAIYIQVGKERFWNRSQVAPLIARRLKQLDEIDALAHTTIPVTHRGNWDNPEAFTNGWPELQQQVKSARAAYKDLLHEAMRGREVSVTGSR
jgi:hypothetical protein